MATSLIAICNQKGGVGKTTTAVNLGAYLARGNRVLLVDLDPQANATIACGVQRNAQTRTLYDCIVDGVSIEEIIVGSSVDGMRVVPSGLDMAGCEIKMSGMSDREAILKRICEPAAGEYDMVLFDCPPSLGLITVNALVSSSHVIIPVQCEYLALEGLNALANTIDLVRRSLNPAIQIGGIVLTMTDFRSTLAREVATEVKKFFKDLVFESVIPRNIRLAESPSFGKPVCIYDPHSTGALAYQLLANEVSERIPRMTATRISNGGEAV